MGTADRWDRYFLSIYPFVLVVVGGGGVFFIDVVVFGVVIVAVIIVVVVVGGVVVVFVGRNLGTANLWDNYSIWLWMFFFVVVLVEVVIPSNRWVNFQTIFSELLLWYLLHK